MSKKKVAALNNFEQSLTELGHLVETMEQGKLSLEESLLHYERGIALVRHCQQVLTQAEQQVTLLNNQTEKETFV